MLRWIGLAVLGILIAATISIAASRLASQQIGLASEPISAGDALAPPGGGREPRRHPSHSHSGKRQSDHSSPLGRSTTPELPQQQVVPSSPESNPPPVTGPDDSGGSGGGEPSAGGADD